MWNRFETSSRRMPAQVLPRVGTVKCKRACRCMCKSHHAADAGPGLGAPGAGIGFGSARLEDLRGAPLTLPNRPKRTQVLLVELLVTLL